MARLPDKILIVRHGARLDETMPAVVFRDVDVGYDTPLTYGGFKQAQALGAHLAHLLLLPGNPDRRKKRIIVHSSPFARCIQTSIGLAAGMAQVVAPTTRDFDERKAPDHVSGMASPYSPLTLRIDPWLGEWMTEQYFEHWDAALLRSSEIVIRARDLLLGTMEAEGIRIASSTPSGNAARAENMVPSIPSIQSLSIQALSNDGNATYQPPRPNHAVLSSDPIPKGYVAHARDACIDFDRTWVGLRDGGTYGERWSAFHARIAAGLQELIQWYRAHPVDGLIRVQGEEMQEKHSTPTETARSAESRLSTQLKSATEVLPGKAINTQQLNSPGSVDLLAMNELQDMSIKDQDTGSPETEEELIVILVTHAGGCNKLLHFFTQQPVLIDFPHSSMILAVKNENFHSSGQLECLSKQYRTVLQASTDHLNSTAKFRTIKELSNTSGVTMPRQSRSSSRSNRRTTLTSISPITTMSPMRLWGQAGAPESGSISASTATPGTQAGLWRPNGGTPIRRATVDQLENTSMARLSDQGPRDSTRD